ncbi:hypothetical protein LXA43DRAFT_1112014, partial [Ganoderma leucocontextum]
GADRLARIVLTESAHLIWTPLRCERVIQWANEDARVRTHPTPHIVRAWRHRINGRIRMEQLSTSCRWHKRSVPSHKVEQTWLGVLEDEDALPPDWIRVPGVLVGL